MSDDLTKAFLAVIEAARISIEKVKEIEIERLEKMAKVERVEFDPSAFEGFDLDEFINQEEPIEEEKIVSDEKIVLLGKKYDVNNFWIDDYLVSPKHVKIFKLVENVFENGGYINLLALGEAGTGKTTFPYYLAKFFGVNHTLVDCATKTDPLSWFGQRTIENGDTSYERTEFSQAIEKGNLVCVLDEVNRTRPDNRGTLLGLLDDRRETQVMNNKIKVGKGTVFYSTANVGYEYIGTTRFDKAEYDRYTCYILFEPLDKEQEVSIIMRDGSIGEKAANYAVGVIRNIKRSLQNGENDSVDMTMIPFSLSVRRAKMIAQLIETGIRPKEAVELAIVNGVGGEMSQNIQTIVNRIRL